MIGTSVAMIEEHYRVLSGGAVAAIAAGQEARDAEQEQVAERPPTNNPDPVCPLA